MTDPNRSRAEVVLDELRHPPEAPQLLRGFGPLVLGLVLVVVMVLLLPSVAPERIVERPADAPPTTGTAQ